MELTVIGNMITCLYFLAGFGLILLANFIYDVWKNRKRDYVGEIRRGELAIENDSYKSLIVCCDFIWPLGYRPEPTQSYYCQHKASYKDWYSHNTTTTLPTIKASELIKHLNK